VAQAPEARAFVLQGADDQPALLVWVSTLQASTEAR
jgi:hypothetical protein